MTAQAERGGHTPGPWLWHWAVDRNGNADGRIHTDQRHNTLGMAVCIAVSPRYQTKEQWEADARLIVRACNLVMAGRSLQDAQQAKIAARGDLPPDLDWGLSEGEQAAALMMNALIEQNDAMLAALKMLLPEIEHDVVRGRGLFSDLQHTAVKAAIAKAQGTAP